MLKLNLFSLYKSSNSDLLKIVVFDAIFAKISHPQGCHGRFSVRNQTNELNPVNKKPKTLRFFDLSFRIRVWIFMLSKAPITGVWVTSHRHMTVTDRLIQVWFGIALTQNSAFFSLDSSSFKLDFDFSSWGYNLKNWYLWYSFKASFFEKKNDNKKIFL